jgi:PAS domain S-box-containing protein
MSATENQAVSPRSTEPPRLVRSAVMGYAVAVVSVALLTGIRLFLKPQLGGDVPFGFFYIAVLFTAWYAGFGPAMLALALGTLSAICFFLPPDPNPDLRTAADSVTLGVYFFIGIFIALLCAWLRTAQRRAEQHAAQALDKQKRLEQEIAERQRVDEALIRERNLLRTVIDNLPDYVYTKDTEHRFIMNNVAHLHALGAADQEEVVGKTDCDFFAPEIAAQYHADEDRILQSGKAMLNYEQPRIDRAGHRQWVLASKVPFRDGSGQVVGLVGISRDISERKQAEVALQKAAEAAEAANRAKSDFLANVSHELRTPLTGILGMTAMALASHLSAEQREHLDLVRDSATVLLGLINDLLDFSKIEAGQLALDPHDFNLHASLRDTMKVLGVQASQKGLELAYHIAPDVPEMLVGDSTRLRQIIVNLVGNAIKFTEHGEVTVSVERERAERGAREEDVASAGALRSAGCALRFTVRDTGIGIPRDQQGRIFGAFVQADGSTSRKYGGTGLGLAISTRLVESMNGRIWVESEVGEGSVFSFTVILGQSQGDGPPELPSGSSPRERPGLRILLAEDNLVNQRLAAWLLEKRGHRLVIANNGREALAAFEEAERGAPSAKRPDQRSALCASRSAPFDLILMDVQMPDTDGLEATAAIRRREQASGQHIPIIALTAHAMEGDRDRCLAAGMDDFISKPLQDDELFRVIAAHCPAAPVHETTALARVGGNAGLLKELVELFRGECPGLMADMRQAIIQKDASRLRRVAHTLKGSAATIGAAAVSEAAWRLESMGRTGDLAGALEAYGTLEQALGQVKPPQVDVFSNETLRAPPLPSTG